MSDQQAPARVPIQPRRVVTVTFGEEKITTSAYQTVTIGPFTLTRELAPYDNYIAVLNEMNDLLAAEAENIRRKKLSSFLNVVQSLKQGA